MFPARQRALSSDRIVPVANRPPAHQPGISPSGKKLIVPSLIGRPSRVTVPVTSTFEDEPHPGMLAASSSAATVVMRFRPRWPICRIRRASTNPIPTSSDLSRSPLGLTPPFPRTLPQLLPGSPTGALARSPSRYSHSQTGQIRLQAAPAHRLCACSAMPLSRSPWFPPTTDGTGPRSEPIDIPAPRSGSDPAVGCSAPVRQT